MQLGIDTFGEVTADRSGRTIGPRERLRDVLEEIELAEARTSSVARRRSPRRSSPRRRPAPRPAPSPRSRAGSIELFGTEVAPMVREEVARRTARPAARA